MKYLSIDIETTGLDPNVNQIIEFAAVLEDSETNLPINELPSLHLVTPSLNNQYIVDPYCASLHKDLWPLLAKAPIKDLQYSSELSVDGVHYVLPKCIFSSLKSWLTSLGLRDWKIVLAGKNVAGFDLPFLRNNGPFEVSYRTIDPASALLSHSDTSPPSLYECLSRCNMTPTNLHSALGDAIDIVRILRKVGFRE